jgi:pilus assembly protein CpaE
LDKASVLIIDHVNANDLKERLGKNQGFFIAGATENPDLGFTIAERQQPDVILLNIDLPGNEGTSWAEILSMEFPMSSLLLVTTSDSKKVLHLALQVGAKGVLNLPMDDDRLIRTVQKAVQQDKRRRELFSVQRKVKPQFKTIVVFSTKGGVGKTTLSLSLGAAIRQITGKRVAAMDLDLFSGNLALMAGAPWKYSIKDIVDDINSLDRETLDSYLAEHPSGLKLLPSPMQPEFAGFIHAEHVEKILSVMSEAFNYVIVDTPTYLHDTAVPALAEAREIIVVTTLDLAAIQNMKQCIDLLTTLAMKPKVRVVVNKLGYTGGLKIKDLEDELGMKVLTVIPNNEKAAMDAVNLGIPLITSAKGTLTARRIEELATKMLTSDDQPASVPGFRLARR